MGHRWTQMSNSVLSVFICVHPWQKTPLPGAVMTASELAGKIDHTILKPEATAPEVHRVVAEAIEHRFATVCVAPAWLRNVATMLRGSGVKACTVIGFPHGTNKSTIKAIEAT